MKLKTLVSAVLLATAVNATAIAEQALIADSQDPITEYAFEERCGIVNPLTTAPYARVSADINSDGVPEHFYANWGVIERHVVQRGSVPKTHVRAETMYRSQASPQYSCVDLRLHDIDGDSDLDLVYASHRELVVFENNGGNLSQSEQYRVDGLNSCAPVRIRFAEDSICVSDGSNEICR